MLITGSTTIRIWFMCIFVVAQMVCANYFQALGKIKVVSLLNLIRQVLVLIPLIVICANIFGWYGIFFAVPSADVTSAIITVIVLKREGTSFIQIVKRMKPDGNDDVAIET